MGRRRIRIGLDVGVAHIRIVAVDGDTTEVVSVCTLATGTSPLKPLEMSARLRQFAQRSEGRESPTEGAGRDDLTERLHTALQQSAGSGSFAAQDVETVVLGTTWGTYPIGQSESPAVGLVIVGAPWSLERFTAPSSDSFSNPIRLLSLRLDPEQVGHEAVLRNTLYDLRSRGARVLVVADEAATSRREREVVAASVALGMPALALHDLAACQPAGGNDQAQNLLLRSLLIAGFLPRLVRLVELVEKSLRRCDITAPLLIMGNDAGVLRPDEFLRQPASALFSGHVASIIGTLIEEGSGASTEENAVILHIGGASTTVAPVRRGELITGSPRLEEVETGLPGIALQVVRLAGESLIRLRRGTIVGVGPKTAHELGIPPALTVSPEEIRSAHLVLDSDAYALLETPSGRRIGLTVTCAAAVLGILDSASPGEDDRGKWEYRESARIACYLVGQRIALGPEDVAELVLNRAADHLAETIHVLLRKNRMDRRTPVIASGAAAPLFVRLLEENHGLNVRIVARPGYTGAVGLARAELGQRQAASPTPSPLVAPDQRARLVAQAMMIEESEIELLAETDLFEVYAGTCRRRQFFGLRRGKQRKVFVCQKDGAIRLRLGDAFVISMTAGEAVQAVQSFLHWAAGENRAVPFPVLYLLRGRKILDLCHLPHQHQIMQMIEEELHGLPGDTPVILLAEQPGN